MQLSDIKACHIHARLCLCLHKNTFKRLLFHLALPEQFNIDGPDRTVAFNIA